MAEDKTKRIRELIGTLRAAGRAYYQESREIMSNFEYDKLYDELVSLEKETGIVFANSPTQNVGYEVVSALPKERHEKPMLSLNKTKSVEELADWLGGQTGLTLAMQLSADGFLQEHGVRLLGTDAAAIDCAEDRELFKKAMERIGQPTVPSDVAHTAEAALAVAERIGYPVIVRPAFTLGGDSGGTVYLRLEGDRV